MLEIQVDGSLDDRLERLISVFNGGFSNYGGTGNSFIVSIGASATVSLIGGGLFAPTTGPTFLNGTVNEFDLVELDLEALQNGQGVQFIDLINISGLSLSAPSLFSLVERTQTTVSGQFIESAFENAISTGNWQITGGDNDDVLAPARLMDLSGNDTLIAGIGNDVLDGGSGSDSLSGGAGDDTLMGGTGADAMDGGEGTDMADYSDAAGRVKIDLLDLSKNTGDAMGDTFASIEILKGGSKKDTFLGDLGANILMGEGGNDDLRGRSDRDTIFGGDGDDRLDAGKGRDRMDGDDGNDLMLGKRGADNLRGGQGDDTLDGGTENDLLIGGKGRDVLIGGTGNDELQGNGGPDTFIFADGHGVDTVTDFDALDAREKLDFSALSTLNSLNDVTGPGGAASQKGGDVLIDTGGGNSILLQNVTLADLDAGDFIFV